MSRPAKPLVLHVDDDPDVRATVARALGRAGFALREAHDGASGIAAAIECTPDVVLLDVHLPDLSGFEVCQRLRADQRTRWIPIVHLSAAYKEIAHRVEGLEGGADAYLVQPVTPAEIVATLRAMLRMRRAEDDARRLARRLRDAARTREQAHAHAEAACRAPLAAIEMDAAALAASAGDPVTAARAARIGEARRAIERLLSGLLDVARLEAGRVTLRVERHGADELLEAAARRARELGCAVEVLPPPSGLAALCDREWLAWALAHLAESAHGSRAGGAAVTLRAAADGALVRFTVEDDGPPIAAGDVARLFSPAVAEPGRSRRARAGMGLAIARAVAEAHGGQIWPEEGRAHGAAVHLAVASPPAAEAGA